MLIFDREGGAHSRTLRVRLPVFAEPAGRERERLRLRGRGLPAVGWTPVRLSGREGVNSLFSYELVLKADEADGAFGASGASDRFAGSLSG